VALYSTDYTGLQQFFIRRRVPGANLSNFDVFLWTTYSADRRHRHYHHHLYCILTERSKQHEKNNKLTLTNPRDVFSGESKYMAPFDMLDMVSY